MTMMAKFAGTCAECKTRFAVGTMIDWAKGQGARHADVDVCASAKAAAVAVPTATVGAVNMTPIAAFITAARARGLKFPKARFLAPGGGELLLSVAGPKSKASGSVQVKIDATWIGRVNLDGSITGWTLASRPDVLATLNAIAEDPARLAKEYGALMGHCSFCNLPLTDEGSVEMGYGPICAKHWGLPHKAKGTKVLDTVVA